MSLLNDLINLDLSDSTEKIIAEYIWIGGSGMDLRSKGRTLPGPVSDPHRLPKWNYDGSSTGQAPGEDSEVILYPQAIFKDPFRRGNNILVMCDAYTPAGEPIPTNKRYNAAKIFSHPHVVAEVPWYGIEQEYTLLQKDVKWPIGWPVGGYPGPQGPYYCSAGADKAFGRDIVDAHYKACLYAGINISGINGEVMPGQWEFQVGPSVGISAGDELWVARYILERITEIAGVVLSFDPKPIQGDWNGAGAHTKYSPQAIFKDPFRRGNNILVMCDAYTPAGEPIPTNKRYNAAKIFSHPHVVAEVPWYGIEQEYTLLQKDVKWPIGWPVGGYPGPQLIKAYYYRYNQEEVSSYHAHGQYQNEAQLRDMGATAASNGSTNSDSLDQILARLSSMLEFDPSRPDYHLWNHGTVQPTVNNGNQDHDEGSVSRPTSLSSSERNLGPIVPPAGGQRRDSCPVVCDDFYCGGHLFKAIYSFFVGKVKAHVD